MPGNIINLTPEQIASWPTPNYVDPERRTFMPAYASVWFAVGTVFVGTRFGLRLQNAAGKFGLDDAFLFAAWLVGVMFYVSCILIATYGKADRHIWDIPPDKIENMTLVVWLGEFSYLLCSCLCRISVLLFFRRLTDGLKTRKWKILVFGAIAFTAAWSLAFIIALFLNCRPFEAYWKAFDFSWGKEFTCTDTSAVNELSGILAVLSDTYAVLLPFLITWNLQLPRRQKWAINAIFSIGMIVVAASAVRTWYTVQVSKQADISTAVFNVFVWSQAEIQLAFMCASAPSLRVLFRKYFMSSLSRSGRRTREISSNGLSSRPDDRNTNGRKSPFISTEPNTSRLDLRESKVMQAFYEKQSNRDVERPHTSATTSTTVTDDKHAEPTYTQEYEMRDMRREGRQFRSQHGHPRGDEMLFHGREESLRSVV